MHQSAARPLTARALESVHGGDDYEGSQDELFAEAAAVEAYEAPAVEEAPHEAPMTHTSYETETHAATTETHGDHRWDGIPMPDPITEAPEIPMPTAEQLARGPSAQEMFETQVNIAQVYQDTASPAELQQGLRGDCFNVASTNALNAFDSDYMHSLATETRNPNVMGVHTWDRDGSPRFTHTQLAPIRGGAYTDDGGLQAAYNATSLLYHPGSAGGSSADAMQRYGVLADNGRASWVVESYRSGDGAAVLASHDDKTLERSGGTLADDFRSLNLVSGHAYQVAAVIRNEADNRDYVVLRNPWRSGTPESPAYVHPLPIPVEDINRYFPQGTLGRTNRSR